MILMQKYQQVEEDKKKIFLNNLLGGLAWGIGATIGLSLILTIIGLIAKEINTVPLVGSFVSNIIDFVLKNNQHFKQ